MFASIHPLVLLMTLIGAITDLAVLIIGCIIVSGKIKSVKILGIGYIVSGALGLFSQFLSLARYIVSYPNYYSSISQLITVAGVVATLFGTLCICLFIHKNYGYKWIYFPLFAQPVVSAVARVVSGAVFSRIGGVMMVVVGMGLSTSVTSLVTGSVTAIILIVVFYKNRKAEKIIPHFWVIKLIAYCWSLILTIGTIIFYTVCICGGANAEKIYFDLSANFTLSQYIFTMINSFVRLVLPIYILVMAKKAERKPEETSAYIEE